MALILAAAAFRIIGDRAEQDPSLEIPDDGGADPAQIDDPVVDGPADDAPTAEDPSS